MTNEYQVLYREMETAVQIPDVTGVIVASATPVNPVPKGPVLSTIAVAEEPEDLEWQFKNAGFFVVSVNFIRAMVDWDKPYWNREEFAYVFGMTPNSASKRKGAGDVPHSRFGNGVYPVAWVKQMVLQNANPAGKAIAKKLAGAQTN